MLEFLRNELLRAQETRAALKAKAEGILSAPKAENRGLKDTERTAFDAAMADLRAKNTDIENIERQIAEAEAAEQRASAAGRALVGAGRRSGGALVGVDEVYRRGSGCSYFQDMVAARVQPTPAVQERLNRHATMMDQALASGEVERRARLFSTPADVQGLEMRVNPNRTDGQGGYFVPPMWLMEEYVDYARAARAVADLLRPIPLPAGTDSINLPKIATGTATGVQTADAAAVTSQDMTDTTVSATVRTIAGQQDFALQLMEQSPLAFDEIMYRDLLSDYNQKLDIQVINGSNAAGQCKGILNVSGINAVTFTQASPTLPLLWLPIMQAASKVANGVFQPPTAIAMTASEWYWASSQLDTTNRPLLGGLGPNNSYGSVARAAQNAVGQLGPWNAIGDANIPANLGSGTNESRVMLAAWDELFLFEGTPRVRVLQEVLSGTLQVRVQVYNYVAVLPDRRPTAISVISGTGLIAPAGF